MEGPIDHIAFRVDDLEKALVKFTRARGRATPDCAPTAVAAD